MKTKFFFIGILLMVVVMSSQAQVSGSFMVNGDLTKWYPVTFSDSTGWFNNDATELELGRSSYLLDGAGRGSLISKFRYHGSNWGNGSNFIDADIRQAPGTNNVFIAGWRDADETNASRRFIIWLRGGGTTYYYKSNYAVNPVIYDDVQNSLPYVESGGPSHSYKTTVDPYVNKYGMSYNNSAFFNGTTTNYFAGNLGVGTDTPLARLHIEALQGSVLGKFTYSNVPAVSGYLNITNATNTTGSYIPNIQARAYAPGLPYGLYITGEADDVLPNGYASAAALVLDGRNKTGAALANNNVLAINNFGQNLFLVKSDGDIGIGTQDTKGYKLAVNGSAIFTRAKVEAFANWPDYVFENNYSLMPLSSLGMYISEHKHLPDVPSAAEVAKEGIDLGDMNKVLLQKLEELTLYLLDMHKNNEELKQRVGELEQQLKRIQK